MTDRLEFTIPLPPSANKLWVPVAKGKMIKSEPYKAWLQEAGWMVKQQMLGSEGYGLEHIDGDADVAVTLVLPLSRMDIDNPIKPTLDVLEAVGVFTNDRQVKRLVVEYEAARPDMLVIVSAKV